MRLFRNLVTSQLWWPMPLIPALRRPAELSHQDLASNNNKGRQWEIKLPKGCFCTPRFYLDLELDKWDAIIVKDWEGHSVRTICPDSPCPVFVTVLHLSRRQGSYRGKALWPSNRKGRSENFFITSVYTKGGEYLSNSLRDFKNVFFFYWNTVIPLSIPLWAVRENKISSYDVSSERWFYLCV